MEATIWRCTVPTKIHRLLSPIGGLDAQRGGQLKDLAAIQRGGELQKLWTKFYSFFNTTYNLAAERTNTTDVDYLLCTMPAVLGYVLQFI